MEQPGLATLTQELAVAQQELSAMRKRLTALEQSAQPRTHVAAWTSVAVVAASVLLLLMTAPGTMYAQGAGQTVRAPFEVVNSAGRTILKVYDSADGKQGLSVSNANGGVAAVVRTNPDGSGALGIFDGTQAPGTEVPRAAGMMFDKGYPEFQINNGDGAWTEIVANELLMAHDNHYVARIKYWDDTGGTFSSYDDQGKSVAMMASSANRGTLVLGGQGKDVGIALGTAVDGSGGIELFDGAKNMTAVLYGSPGANAVSGAKPDRGLTIFNQDGQKAVESFVDAGGRGNFRASDANGHYSAALMATSDLGGRVFLADVSGKVRMDLGSRGFSAFNPAGQSVVELGSNQSGSSGRMWIGNAAGDGLIEAGMLPDGKGIVRVGPMVGGPPPGLVLPDRIVGHIQSK